MILASVTLTVAFLSLPISGQLFCLSSVSRAFPLKFNFILHSFKRDVLFVASGISFIEYPEVFFWCGFWSLPDVTLNSSSAMD